MRFHLISLGCPKNTADSEGLIAALAARGGIHTASPDEAELILINTCGFIRDAKEESITTIMRAVELKKSRPGLRVVAFGCLAKRYLGTLRDQIPELDGLFEFYSGCELDAFFPPAPKKPTAGRKPATPLAAGGGHVPRLTPAHIGYLKIAEGCDNRCAYCAIPDIRGPFRPRPLKEILADAERLAATGTRELVIVAQDTVRFGGDHGSELPSLIRRLGEHEAFSWIRLQYLHPKRLTPRLIDELFTLPKVLPYFDIPFQHVADRLLGLMNRGVGKRDLVSLIGHIRRTFRRATLRTTFIVGFPGETGDEFQELLQFLEDHPIDRVGAFPYSREEDTPADRLRPQITKTVKRQRLDELMTLQGLLSTERNARFIGKRRSVIIDRIEDGTAFCRSEGDAFEIDTETTVPEVGSDVQPGDLIDVRVTAADAYDFVAERIVRR